MKDYNKYKQELLRAWEETYKKGQLTFWLLFSLRNEPRYVTDIKDFIQNTTKNTITCEDQSLYRALRKFYDLEIVNYEMHEGNRGPERKYYYLTSLGQELLEEFIQRNIRILYNKELSDLIKSMGGENDSSNKTF